MAEMYTPSDEEMGGLARALASMTPDEEWSDKTTLDDEYRASKEWEADDLIQTPEFQQIIRTAQESAAESLERAELTLQALESWARTEFYWTAQNAGTVGRGFGSAQRDVLSIIERARNA